MAGLAFLPYALWVLAAAPLLPAVGVLLLCLSATLGPLVAVDRHYYGAWTVSEAVGGAVCRGAGCMWSWQGEERGVGCTPTRPRTHPHN